jgi:hypothetical protein
MALNQMALMMVLKMKSEKKMGDQMKVDQRMDGWMDGPNSAVPNRGEVVSHPFRTPLFRFSFNALRQIKFYCYLVREIKKGHS